MCLPILNKINAAIEVNDDILLLHFCVIQLYAEYFIA